jgi:hypothetical protein
MKINITLLFSRLQSNTKHQDNDQNIPVDKMRDSLQYTRDLLSIGMKDYLPESKRASATFYNASLHYE